MCTQVDRIKKTKFIEMNNTLLFFILMNNYFLLNYIQYVHKLHVCSCITYTTQQFTHTHTHTHTQHTTHTTHKTTCTQILYLTCTQTL